MAKPRSDSLLKCLPEDRQEQIIEWCNTPKSEDCVGGYAYAREQLAADGIKASIRAISDFYSWFLLKQRYEQLNQFAEDQRAQMLEFDPADVDRAERYADFLFIKMAAQHADPKAYVAVSGLRHDRKVLETKKELEAKKLALAERRVLLLEDNAAKAKAALQNVVSKGGLTPETLKTIEEAAGLL